MTCSKCGAEIADGAAYCSACGQPQTSGLKPDDPSAGDEAPSESHWERRTEGQRTAGSPARFVYAGFWLRLAAFILDSLLLGSTAGFALFGTLMNRGAISAEHPWAVYTGTSQQDVAIRLLIFMIEWVYFALLESSPWRASVGKKVLGLVVTDLKGNRISFTRASARYFCTILSGFILMAGFIMIAFTQKKQGLHDILTGCLVIKKV